MSRETWYVLENGSVADPFECALDAKGVLRHKGGMAVKVRGDTHWSRGVDVDAERAKAKPQPQAKAMTPAEPQLGYLTRDSGAAPRQDAGGDVAALRAEYKTKFGKAAFAGWDAAALRDKIKAAD